MFDPDRYVAALWFAAERHREQKLPGTELPYMVHVTSVAAEIIAVLPHAHFDAELAVMCALLHDTIEDTQTTPEDIAAQFGPAVRDGVAALSKHWTFSPIARSPAIMSASSATSTVRARSTESTTHSFRP
jgi:(p)ppGpp synthase/HD superfamily hydrolase